MATHGIDEKYKENYGQRTCRGRQFKDLDVDGIALIQL
jgi:hypothetical protein